MSLKIKYILSTSLYGLTGVLGILTLIYFIIKKDIFLTLLSLIVILVSIDNFFCGKRAKVCNSKIKTPYILPWKINSHL